MVSPFEQQLRPGYKRLIKEICFNSFPKVFSHRLIGAYTPTAIDVNAFQQIVPDIGESRRLYAAERTEFGDRLAEVLKGRWFIDLGCGHYPAPHIIAEACASVGYVGVDAIEKGKVHKPISNVSSFPSFSVTADMLTFLNGLQDTPGVVFHLSGIEPYELEALSNDEYNDKALREKSIHASTRHYIDACLQEMQRVTRAGDAIIIGPATVGFHPENYGFKQTIQSEKYRYSVYVKQ